MTEVGIQQAKRELSRLLTLVEGGKEVVITRYGKPIARLIRVDTPVWERQSGRWRDSLRMADDFDAE